MSNQLASQALRQAISCFLPAGPRWQRIGQKQSQTRLEQFDAINCCYTHRRDKRPRTGEGCDLGNSGFWNGDYGWGVRVRRPFGARGMSSVRYRTRLGDLKNKQSTEGALFFRSVCLCQRISERARETMGGERDRDREEGAREGEREKKGREESERESESEREQQT